MALGLLIGYLASAWYQNDQGAIVKHNTSVNKSINNQVDEVKFKPVLEAAPIADKVVNPLPEIVAPIDSQQDILSDRLRATDDWLANHPANTASIQIMGGRESLQLKSDLNALSEQVGVDNIYVYRTQVKGRPFLNVLYGSFANKLDAIEALEHLPAAIKKNQPQIRTIAGVLQETKQLP